MRLILKSITNEIIKSFSLKKFEIFQNSCGKLSSIKAPATANLITENEKLIHTI